MDAMPQKSVMPASPANASLALNPQHRLACCLVLDISNSMVGRAIDQLNVGLQQFDRDISADPVALRRVETAAVTFGNPVKIARDFATHDQSPMPTLSVQGDTPMGQAMERALDIVEARKRTYEAAGVGYYRPWVLIFTDGSPTDSIDNAIKRVKAAEADKKALVYGIGVEGADMDVLRRLCVRPPIELANVDFPSLFLWLSKSLRTRSGSAPHIATQTAPLPRTMTVSS